MKLWLDDVRPAPDGWIWARSAEEAIKLVLAHRGEVDEMSLDHDLSELDAHGGTGYMPTAPRGLTGYDFVRWLAENDRWPAKRPTVHSQNPAGAKSMRLFIDKHFPVEGWSE